MPAERSVRVLSWPAKRSSCGATWAESRTGANATKPQRTFDCKVKDCSDDDFAPTFGLESTVPIGTRHLHHGRTSQKRSQQCLGYYLLPSPCWPRWRPSRRKLHR
jgi:hypothetical protein